MGLLAEKKSFSDIIRKYVFGLNFPLPENKPKKPSFGTVGWKDTRKKPEPTSSFAHLPYSTTDTSMPYDMAGNLPNSEVEKSEIRDYTPEEMASRWATYHNPGANPTSVTDKFDIDNYPHKLKPEGNDTHSYFKKTLDNMLNKYKPEFEKRGMYLEQDPMYWMMMRGVESSHGIDRDGDDDQGDLQANRLVLAEILKDPHEAAKFNKLYGTIDGVSGADILNMAANDPKKFEKEMEVNESNIATVFVLYLMKSKPVSEGSELEKGFITE